MAASPFPSPLSFEMDEDESCDMGRSKSWSKLHVYPPYVVNLVLKLRAASYKEGGTDLASLFARLDTDDSGCLDYNEFKRVIRRCVSSCLECLIAGVNHQLLESHFCTLFVVRCTFSQSTTPTPATNTGSISYCFSAEQKSRKECIQMKDLQKYLRW